MAMLQPDFHNSDTPLLAVTLPDANTFVDDVTGFAMPEVTTFVGAVAAILVTSMIITSLRS